MTQCDFDEFDEHTCRWGVTIQHAYESVTRKEKNNLKIYVLVLEYLYNILYD